MTNALLTPQQALILRLAIGLVFGLIIAAMFDHISGPDEGPLWMQVLAPVLILGAFVVWAGAGAMRRLSLLAWCLVAFALIALIAWNSAVHGDRYNPVFANFAFLIYPFLFIAHELVSSGDQANKPVAPFSLYFDQAWKHGVQLALAVLFTAIFWAILWLGATLLGFIGFDWFKRMLESEYFAWPASGLAIAAAVHLGDVQTKLMHSFRSLVLGVMSWLLPVITVIGVIFAVSLCFSGLEPLWKTKAATASLLAACVALVLLINATYQQGDEERPVHVILKWAVRLACFLVLIFSVLAAYSLYLRIAQYGLTPERVLAAVGVIIAVLFGIGYSVAAVMPGRWMQRLETVNIALAFVKVVVFLAVLTPLADPLRLSAESQTQRLVSGAVSPDQFDWRVLRFETGTYGRDALARLSKDGKTEAIRKKAMEAVAVKDDERWVSPVAAPAPVFKPEPRQIVMLSKDTAPDSFFAQTYSDTPYPFPACLQVKDKTCEARMFDLDGDDQKEMLLYSDPYLFAFSFGTEGWALIDNGQALEGESIEAFRKGTFTAEPQRWKKLRFGIADTIEYRDVKFEPPSATVNHDDIKFVSY